MNLKLKHSVLALLCTLTLNTAMAGNRYDAVVDNNDSIKVKLTTTPLFYEKVLMGLWEDLNTEIDLPSFKMDEDGALHTEVTGGHISLNTNKNAIFGLSSIGKNKLLIKWKLQNTVAKFRVRADFNKNILGIIVRKHEEFDVDARVISNAESEVDFSFSEGLLKVEKIANRNFKFDNIKVKSTDDDVTTWVLRKLEEKCADFVNAKITKSIQSEEIVTKLLGFVNEKISTADNIDVKINDFGTRFQIHPKIVAIDPEKIDFGFNTVFNPPDAHPHECTREMVSKGAMANVDQNLIAPVQYEGSNVLALSRGFVEQFVLNIASYEKDADDDGLIDEPIFCFGYKDGRSDGKSEIIPFNLLGKERKMKIKFWGSPIKAPKFTYEKDEKVGDYYIVATMDFRFRIEEQEGHPKLSMKGDSAVAQLIGKFKMKTVPGKGQALDLKSIQVNDFQGDLKVQLVTATPKVSIPFSVIEKAIEGSLADSVREDLASDIIINEGLEVYGFKLNVEKIKILEKDFVINFNYN